MEEEAQEWIEQLVKVPKVDVSKLFEKKDQLTMVLVLRLLLGSSVLLNILLLSAIFLDFYLSYHKSFCGQVQGCCYTWEATHAKNSKKQLKASSKYWVGKGAFGTVYKGVLASDRKRFVAIKKLDKIEQEGEKEFKTEVNVIGQTHHTNLVRLVGFCDEGDRRLQVYEYLSKWVFGNFLFGITRPDWNQRVQIAFGIARGLIYLHEECST